MILHRAIHGWNRARSAIMPFMGAIAHDTGTARIGLGLLCGGAGRVAWQPQAHGTEFAAAGTCIFHVHVLQYAHTHVRDAYGMRMRNVLFFMARRLAQAHVPT